MLIFNPGRKKQQEAQRLLVRILNQQHQTNVRMSDVRQEQRSNTTVPVIVVPYLKGKPLVDEAVHATTRDLSSAGIGLVVNHPIATEEILIGFRSEAEVFYIRATVKYQDRISANFYQVGASANEVLHASDYPLLATLPL